ncbi:MAG: HlyD family efflux transporter periplasmic adaptor subunit, partial [Muribaculaceae bacterium]|nr:HlyD family efflux transporter periplasmic adaptor subunit [Muribaculaceae bacterium]
AETALRTAELELEQLRQRLENERLRSQAAEEVQALNVSSIEKDLNVMRSTLQRGRITAQNDGILTFIVNEIGSQISAGQKVAVVSNLSSFKILGEIAEGASERMVVGARVLIRIGNSELNGTVTNITPQSRGGIVEFVVNADDPRNPRLRSGVRAELYISYGFRDAVVRIQAGEYYKGAGEYKMFVMTGDNRLERRKVKLGEGNRQYVEVISGLKPGDRVVISDMTDYENKSSLKIK